MELKKLTVFLVLLSTFYMIKAQEPKEYDELEHLRGLIHQFMYSHDSVTHDRKSEFILLFLEVDTTGRIESINMMTDPNNSGPTLAALKSITAHDVKGWKSQKNKSKLIVLPVYCLGSEKSAYLDYIQFSPIFTLQQCNIKGKYNFIISQQLFYLWPSSRKSHN